MEKHIKVARVHRALSWLYGLVTVLFLGASLMSGNTPPLAVLFFLIIFGGIFALHHFTAIGAREAKPWARKTSIGIALLMIIGFPLGTLIAIYLLINTTGGWSEESAV
jgi:NADH:ubiquinone oxidoreductase subunit 6 (subunit J)